MNLNLLSTFFINLLSPFAIKSAPVEPPTILPPIAPIEEIRPTRDAPSQYVLASWYGPGFHGNEAASGEKFDEYAMTVAHPYLPFDTLLEITYNGNTVIARVNDRGPYEGNRGIDLSRGVAEQLGFDGVDDVQIRIIN
jgi:rare lipoprotein A (peptidoglycan hydrolase)